MKKFIFLFLFFYSTCFGSGRDGMWLHDSCRKQEEINKYVAFKNDLNEVACLLYVVGTIDTINEVRSKFWPEQFNGWLSTYGSVTPDQIVLVVKKFMKNNPEKLQYPAQEVIISAYQEAFPFKYPLPAQTTNLSPPATTKAK